MSFTSYKTLSQVVQSFHLSYQETNFIEPQVFTVNDYLRAELTFNLTELVVDSSEYALCENIIYPILREIWKAYKTDFMLWSHHPLGENETLTDIPDYLIAKRSPLGKIVFEQPYFIVVEAKKDNFSEGWGQCAAELVAIQQLNQIPEQTLFGIVTNAERWEFAKLQQQQLTKNQSGYQIENLNELFAAINYVFLESQKQLKTNSN
ncbi:hypothetical protein BegalDRAFT_2266 [Beggiatoa alba B18LD]|uniref:Type I restriction enzyme R protein N-terminal domain-containing protein n=1 Tax=Beggiatoa alba B18LD TaxID=395493 RepID=I3CHM7_9GAMM|nr:hypothetical protein [Beggiatoa alba]EIJ43120.1 hypothetical protein BegalDRAFT_2266 [Beggiatoa alba B18LD]